MPSPFPGMDPYLESHWRDVHASLVIYVRDALQVALPADLRARVEERVVLENPQGIGNPLYPDVRVVERPPRPSGGARVVIHPTESESILVDAASEPLTEGFVEVIDVASGNRIVTILEVLSLSNKTPGEGMAEYQRKQREICSSDTNLVEINLLRGGRHVLAVPWDNIPPTRQTVYVVCVRRASLRSKAEVYPIPLWQPLPTVKVPLRPGDADVPLDLQTLIEQCYRNGRYDGDLDYRLDPDPPLAGPEQEWTLELFREKGLRPRTPEPKRRKRKGQ